MSSIQATEEETSTFLQLLESISEGQLTICAQLDELTLLMQMPSESTLDVLEGLLNPMQLHMRDLAGTVVSKMEGK
jgi:hypothetical protein